MALNPSCCGPTSPGANDAVIHHRNYRGELTEEQYERLHFKVGAAALVLSVPWVLGTREAFLL